MIKKKSFELFLELWKIDRVLVDSLIQTLSFYEYTIMSGTLRAGYDGYLKSEKPEREIFDRVFYMVISALKN